MGTVKLAACQVDGVMFGPSPLPSIEPKPSRGGPRSLVLPLWHRDPYARSESRVSTRLQPMKLTMPSLQPDRRCGFLGLVTRLGWQNGRERFATGLKGKRMPDHMYPPATREMAQQRRELAPAAQAAFDAFGKAAFADGALPAK